MIVSLYLISSACAKHVPDIITVGECEHGIVTKDNVLYVKKIWQDANITDVLISGGCYQERFIKKR